MPAGCHPAESGLHRIWDRRTTTADGSPVTAAAVLLATGGGPDGHGRPGSKGPARAAPPVLLGRQVISVGLDEPLDKHRGHDVPPRPAAASLVPGPLLLSPGYGPVRYGRPARNDGLEM